MMILHASVTADEPKSAATTLAALLGGRALPVGPGEGTWTAVGAEPIGNFIEVLARGSEFHLAGKDVETRRGDAVRHSGFHLMIDTPLSEEAVLALAEERGAIARRATHGPFELIEFWLDDCLLIEVVTPEMGRAYRQLLHSAELRERYADRVG